MPPRHALDVRIASGWTSQTALRELDEVIHYCRYSACRVGRFMLDVHVEITSTWAASDSLCACLQLNNHLQDCCQGLWHLIASSCRGDALAAAGDIVENSAREGVSDLLQCLHASPRDRTLLNEARRSPPR